MTLSVGWLKNSDRFFEPVAGPRSPIICGPIGTKGILMDMHAVSARLALSVPEAARALGLSRSSAYALMSAGRLPFVKIGRRRLVTIAQLNAFIAGLEEAAMAEASSHDLE